jgi:hypothetical protein
MAKLTPETLHSILAEYLPRKNDDFPSTYLEEVSELEEFGITTEIKLRELLKRRCREALEIDASPMSERDIALHKEHSGEEFVAKRLKEGYWFSYPGLLRIILELEYGEAYQRFSEKRDGLIKGSLRR